MAYIREESKILRNKAERCQETIFINQKKFCKLQLEAKIFIEKHKSCVNTPNKFHFSFDKKHRHNQVEITEQRNASSHANLYQNNLPKCMQNHQ